MVAADASGTGLGTDVPGGRLARGEAPPSAAGNDSTASTAGNQTQRSSGRSGWIIVALVLAALVVGAWVVNRNNERAAISARSDLVQALASTSVEFCWSGTAAGVDLTTNVDGTTEQASDRANDQCITRSARSTAVMSVQNTGSSGSVSCEIRSKDGYVLDSATSTGAYVVAQCLASV
jgi:hypothetical protein